MCTAHVWKYIWTTSSNWIQTVLVPLFNIHLDLLQIFQVQKLSNWISKLKNYVHLVYSIKTLDQKHIKLYTNVMYVLIKVQPRSLIQLTSVADMAPVDEPDANVRILVESLPDPFWPKSILTRSKWCFDPTKSLTTFEGLEAIDGGLPTVRAMRPQPVSSKTGLLDKGEVLLKITVRTLD